MYPIVIVIWIFCGIGASAVATSRGANGYLWSGIGLLFGPFGLAAAFAVGENVVCPSCRKRIHPKAQKCPYCQTQVVGCPSCGKPIRPKAQECPYCQKQLAKEGIVLGISCPRCGFSNDAGWESCVHCSEPLKVGRDSAKQPSQRSASASPDLTGQIERLVELRSKGLLSDEEFRQAKAKLLG